VWCGLVGCGVAAFVVPIFTGSANLSAGPTNASAALLLGTFASLNIAPESRLEWLPTLVLMTGVFLLLASWLRLSGFADFVPRTVIYAYIAAAALRVIALQLPIVFDSTNELSGSNIFEVLWQIFISGKVIFKNIGFYLAIFTGIIFYIIKKPLGTGWAILIAVLITSFVAVISQSIMLNFYQSVTPITSYVGDAAHPNKTIYLPSFTAQNFSTLFSPALALAVLIIIEGTANARASALKTGRPSDLHQEIFGLGMANLACAFSGGMPASGSISRSALNISSGAKTAYASLFCGAIILAFAYLLNSPIKSIPLACLSMLVILVEIELVNFSAIKLILKSGTQDRVVFLSTFLTALLAPLDVAIFFGTAVAIAFYLRQTSQPEVVEYDFSETGEITQRTEGKSTTAISILHVEGSLHFGATQAFHEHLRRASADPNLKVLILKFREAHHLDANGVLLLRDLAETLKSGNRHLILCELKPDTLKIFVNADLITSVGSDNFIPWEESNPTAALAKAIKRARALTGESEAVLHIITAPHPGLARPASASGEDWQI
jgi:SulP family sulfate permease